MDLTHEILTLFTKYKLDKNLKVSPTQISLSFKAKPNSSKNIFKKSGDNVLLIAVTSPAIEGRANEAYLEFLSDVFSIPKKKIALRSGEKNSNKIFNLLFDEVPSHKKSDLISKIDSFLIKCFGLPS